ncbi:MAG: thiamine pyrophosphate-dependent enzyme [Myxococcota bacterium]
MISHLGTHWSVADGLALAAKLRGEAQGLAPDSVALAFLGEGGMSEGDVHEALNLAAVWRLPVIFVVENNGYGLSTPTYEQTYADFVAKAHSYGLQAIQVDGNDVLQVKAAVSQARALALQGQPTLIEALTFRMRGHEEASGTAYIPAELFTLWKQRDPLDRLTRALTEGGLLHEDDLAAWNTQMRTTWVDPAFESGIAAAAPSTTREAELADVYAVSSVNTLPAAGSATTTRRYIDAISEALEQSMALWPEVVLMGQDIAEYGGAFKVTQGLWEKYGKQRVRNTPIIESGVVGAAIGLAFAGYKPVVEMQFADFVTCAFNQIANNAAKTHYRWGAPINLTIRLPYGGGMGAGPFHSQCPEAWFFHVPGLILVAPANAVDAKGLLIASIQEPNPVLFFEHKGLYRSERQSVPDDPYAFEIGKATVCRGGDDVTLVSYGLGVHWALEAAETLSKEDGVEVEVIDLRTLLPWDKACVLRSLKKTNRLAVVHEAGQTGVSARRSPRRSPVNRRASSV